CGRTGALRPLRATEPHFPLGGRRNGSAALCARSLGLRSPARQLCERWGEAEAEQFEFNQDVRSFLMVKRSYGAASLVFAMGLLGRVPAGLGQDMEQAEQTFNQVCSECHSVETVFEGPRLTAQQWDSTVRDMVGRGANATDEQLDLIRAYLKRSWGAVWINR